MEAVWVFRCIDTPRPELLRELLECDDHHARAAATHQLRFWHVSMPDAIELLRRSMNDSNGIVRMQAAISASYIDSEDSFTALLDVLKHPRDGHLNYAVSCALGSHTMKKYWARNSDIDIAKLLRKAQHDHSLREPNGSAVDAEFDKQKDLKRVEISCLPERMKFSIEEFAVTVGQPVKVVFENPDATDHNLLIVKPGARAEVGMAANAMARDPKQAAGNYHPPSKKHLIVEASPMIGPTRKSRVHVMRFNAPSEPGIYPYVCTFPGHWVMMKGVMVVAASKDQIPEMLSSAKPKIVRKWKMTDFGDLSISDDSKAIMRGMDVFGKANCHQCHTMPGHEHGSGHSHPALGPDLKKVRDRFRGRQLLQQLIKPSETIHADHRTYKVLTDDGEVVTGLIREENNKQLIIVPNLLTPEVTKTIDKNKIEFKTESKVSQMPEGLLDILQATEIMDLLSYLESLE
jgi:putative heme-binding domain-containing protein